MNATVTKSAPKNKAGKTGIKAPAKPAIVSKSDVLQENASGVAKAPLSAKVKDALTAGVAEDAAHPLTRRPANRATALQKNNTKTVTGNKATTAVPSSPKQRPEATTKRMQSDATQSDAYVTSNKPKTISTDKMAKTLDSKVSEVATKTAKSTPAVPTDGALLTEEQILQMSDKDYMNEAQLAFFKARLQQLERDLLKNAGETTEHLRETVLVPDPADRATIEEEHALELRTRDRERKLLKKVQQAIASIDAGDYGWCEETGEPIGIPRLLARPTATLSLEAQQRRELKQKLYGD